MKDALGHGSNSRLGPNGKSIMPSRPFRESDAAAAAALANGPKSAPAPVHDSMAPRTFGGDNPGIKAFAPSRFGKLVSEFAKSSSGEGMVPKALEDFDFREKGPAEIGNTMKDVAASMHEGKLDLHSLVHFAHFLGFLGFLAVIDWIALGLGAK